MLERELDRIHLERERSERDRLLLIKQDQRQRQVGTRFNHLLELKKLKQKKKNPISFQPRWNWKP